MLDTSRMTPMFRQYRSIKQQQPESILLFRMGDFYEMFFEDAKEASGILELTLTARGKGTDNVVPMCGFPHHQLDAYTARLVRSNRKVAICDQVEDPKKARGLVRREIVRVVSPGTITDPDQLDAKSNAWLAAICPAAKRLGAAFCDVSTGEFLAWETPVDATEPWDALGARLRQLAPREIVVPEGWTLDEGFRRRIVADTLITEAEDYLFGAEGAAAALSRRFRVKSMDGFGFRDRPAALTAAHGLLQYAIQTQRSELEHVDRLLFHEASAYLALDASTRRNLELDRSLRDGGRKGSLFDTVDSTMTAAGGRLLRRWLESPLLDAERIDRRLDAVEELHRHTGRREATRDELRGVQDVERLLGRVVAGTAGARDLLGLRVSLEQLPALTRILADCRAPLVRETFDSLDPCTDVAERIAGAIVDQPPASLREGNVIRDGFDAALDELRAIRRDGRSYISSLETAEREASGIPSLKVKFNKVFGYFIEVSKANLHLVPEHYQRKQTIANGERYVTPELKDYEAKVLQAQERIEEIEIELFRALRTEVAGHAGRLKTIARATALADVVAALAERAATHGYCRPKIDDSPELRIVGGRHPVVEPSLVDEPFVPNDTELVSAGSAVAVLTGPNMGGKSTYLRQVALITLMAQAGSFVPARSARIGIVDRIFCRVGASDSLAEGQSTFMVEMTETANILHHATSRSLVLLDEIGRGTSTFDGLSIAWAVVEHLDELAGGAPRSLFATHYHELTQLAIDREHVLNLRMAVREHGDSVVFLHRVEQGASDRSYGIHVARLAGVPRKVVERAREILGNIEREQFGRDGLPRKSRHHPPVEGAARLQPSLFEQPRAAQPGREEREVLHEIRAQAPDHLTPIDALNRLADWIRRLNADRASAESDDG